MKCILLVLICCVWFSFSCQHAGGPLEESTLINYIKKLLAPNIPLKLPSLNVHIDDYVDFKTSQTVLTTLDFSSAEMHLTQPNTVFFSMTDLVAVITFGWTITEDNKTDEGNALLSMTNCEGSITAMIQPNQFKNTNATFKIGNLVFQTSNQPVIEPYWDFFKPVLIDTLQREIPNLILEMDTSEIKVLVYPIVKSVEPVHLPDLNETVLGIYGGFSNMTLTNIDFDAATMGLGSSNNEVVFELIDMTALITNNWEFKALDIDKKGTGQIFISQTTVSITVGIGEDNKGQFTINLDSSNINIGVLDIKINGGDDTIINWLISVFKPLLIPTIESTFQVIVCILFNGIPNIAIV